MSSKTQLDIITPILSNSLNHPFHGWSTQIERYHRTFLALYLQNQELTQQRYKVAMAITAPSNMSNLIQADSQTIDIMRNALLTIFQNQVWDAPTAILHLPQAQGIQYDPTTGPHYCPFCSPWFHTFRANYLNHLLSQLTNNDLPRIQTDTPKNLNQHQLRMHLDVLYQDPWHQALIEFLTRLHLTKP